MSTILTPTFRVSYPNVFKARKNDLSGDNEFGLQAIFAAKDVKLLQALQKAAMDCAVAEWGTDKKKWPKGGNIRFPFKKSDDKLDKETGEILHPHEKGGYYLDLKSKNKPGLVKKTASGYEDIIDSTEFYAGCYALASLTCYAYNQKGNAGVNFGLKSICKVKDGEPLGGGPPNPEKEFAQVSADVFGDASNLSGDDVFKQGSQAADPMEGMLS